MPSSGGVLAAIDGPIEQCDLAAIEPDATGNRTNEGGLASAVRAEQREQLSLVELERRAVESEGLAEALSRVIDRENSAAHCRLAYGAFAAAVRSIPENGGNHSADGERYSSYFFPNALVAGLRQGLPQALLFQLQTLIDLPSMVGLLVLELVVTLEASRAATRPLSAGGPHRARRAPGGAGSRETGTSQRVLRCRRRCRSALRPFPTAESRACPACR
jgi:hypothetical protein